MTQDLRGDADPSQVRPRGRPRRADAPLVDWNEVDRLLVFGEVVKDKLAGHEETRFPSLSELGERYGVSRNRIWQYSKKASCLRRREEARLKIQERYEQKVVEKIARSRALATADVVEVVDDYILGFKQALAEGKVRFDSVGDLDRLVRLKELMLGNADTRTELRAGLTLEGLQERHQHLRGQIYELTPQLAGTTGEAGVVDGADADSVAAGVPDGDRAVVEHPAGA
jgi:hypothetical protein